MANQAVPSTFTVKVFVRHGADCPRTAPQWKRCQCRKSLYIYQGGKVRYQSAKTRSWEQAEKVAQAERDLREPAQIEMRKAAEKKAAEQPSAVTVEDALDHWLGRFQVSYTHGGGEAVG